MRVRLISTCSCLLLCLSLAAAFTSAALCADPPSMEWEETFGGASTDEGYDVQQTVDGGYVICGHKNHNVWLIKTDSSGTRTWDRTSGSGGARDVQRTSDGGYVLAGRKHDCVGSNYVDVWLVKLSPPTPNTPVGSPVTVPLNSVTVTFDAVTVAGDTTYTSQQGNPYGTMPEGFRLHGQFVYITTTASYDPPVTVGISYSPSIPNPQNLKLFRWEDGHWQDVTTWVDTTNYIVYGEVTSFSWFFIGGEWVWVPTGGSGVPVFPSVYIAIGAALAAGLLA